MPDPEARVSTSQAGAVERFGAVADRFARRWCPDPFVFAVLLTALTFALGLIWGFDFDRFDKNHDGRVGQAPAPPGGPDPDPTDNGEPLLPGAKGVGYVLGPFDTQRSGEPGSAVLTREEWPGVLGRAQGMGWAWAAGLWNLLGFSMQMCLILVTGFAVAASPPVKALIAWLAGLPRTTRGAAALTALVAMVTAFLNWGLGLIAGALLAREIGLRAKKHGHPLHYPLVVAAGYVGLMVWHGGLSGSAPLSFREPQGMEGAIKEISLSIPVAQRTLLETTFSTRNLVLSALLLLSVPIYFWLLAPRDPARAQGSPLAAEEPPTEVPAEAPTPADRANRSAFVTLLAVLPLLFLLWRRFRSAGIADLDLNTVNVALIALGLILHVRPERYLAAVSEAASGCAGIILQFPFYAGIMGMMEYSGLVGVIADGMSRAGPTLSPFLTFLSACVINLFVPSGGGQWAVQGPIVLETALRTGVRPGTMVMCLAYGDELTNMLQPFWALPLLGLTGLKARDIMGYTAVVMALALPWYALVLLVFQ